MLDNPDSLSVIASAFFSGLTIMVIVPAAYYGILGALRELRPSNMTARNKH